MRLRVTRGQGPGGPARKLILSGLIVGLAVAGVAMATLAGASTRHGGSSSSSSGAAWHATAMDAPGTSVTQLRGVSDSGTIVGFSSSGGSHGFTVNGATSKHSSWHWAKYPGAAQTTIVAISANGTAVVGFIVTRSGSTQGLVGWNGRWWTVAYPGTSGRHWSNQLTSVNNNGMATGWYKDSQGHAHSYTYNMRTHVFILIVVPMHATSVVVTAINNAGVIVGFVVTRNTTVAFIIQHGTIVVLAFGNKTNTQAWGINSSGTVVGSFVGANGWTHGFMWTSSGMHQMDSPWSSGTTVITAVNNRGQVVGFFIDARGHMRGLVIVFVVVQATTFTSGWNGVPTTAASTTTMPMTAAGAAPAAASPNANGGSNATSGQHW